VQITDQVRRIVEHGTAKLDSPRRPAVTRLEVEITEDPSPRVDGGHRVELTCLTTRPTFRAHASAATIEAALERAVDRLERQIVTFRGKRDARTTRSGTHAIPAVARDRADAAMGLPPGALPEAAP